jgi:hypothetical protein
LYFGNTAAKEEQGREYYEIFVWQISIPVTISEKGFSRFFGL